MGYDDDIDDRAWHLERIGLQLGWNKNLRKCQVCHDRWHHMSYETCYDCRPPWLIRNRMEFTPEQKLDIMERDDFRCYLCQERDTYLHVDHVKPCARGGEADLWNGQVLCSRCNVKKNADWHNSMWPRRRIQLMHFYFTYGWSWLSYAEQELLVSEATGKRMVTGYQRISGVYSTAWLESESEKRKIVIAWQYPPPLASGEHDPAISHVEVIEGWMEERRPVNYGSEFAWHTHAGYQTPPLPRWALDEADSYQ